MKNTKVVSNIIKYIIIIISIIVILSFISIKSDFAFNVIGIIPYTVLSGSMKPKIGYLIAFLSRPLVMAIEMIILAILIVKSCIMDK